MTCGALMVHLPGHGDNYLTMAPSINISLQPAVWVDHNVLRFHAGSELVELVGKANLLERSDFSTIWVYHDPDSASRAVADGRSVEFTAGDSVEQLLELLKVR